MSIKAGMFVRVSGTWRFEGFISYETLEDKDYLGVVKSELVDVNGTDSFAFIELCDND